mgnify:FL=1
MRETKQIRSIQTELKTRTVEDSPEKYIEGYFAVFNKEVELWPGAYEEIALTAFDGALLDDVRALINHDTTLVLGRTKANTLELKTDSTGLWGRITINPNDTDAVNLYERVARGDVDQCSFGFEIVKEETDWRDDGTVKWTLKEVKLFEVSPCTFPAYEQTGIQARKVQVDEHQARLFEARKTKLKERLSKCLGN